MNSPELTDTHFKTRLRGSIRKLARWSAVWVLSDAVLAFGPKFLWHKAVPFTLIAFGVCVLAGAGMIVANRDHLRDQDELMRKVNLEAMAIALGVVVIAGVPYSVLESYGIVPYKGDISGLMMLMVCAFLISLILGFRRYR